jgi:hypothetical protein
MYTRGCSEEKAISQEVSSIAPERNEGAAIGFWDKKESADTCRVEGLIEKESCSHEHCDPHDGGPG